MKYHVIPEQSEGGFLVVLITEFIEHNNIVAWFPSQRRAREYCELMNKQEADGE